MNARPAKKPADKRKHQLKLYANDKEREEIVAIAIAHGYNEYDLSEYLRRVALGYLYPERSKAGLE